MSLTRIRTPLVAGLVLCLLGLAVASWRTSHGSSTSGPTALLPRPVGVYRALPPHRDGVVVVTKIFKSPRNARSYLADFADGAGRTDARVMAAYCPLEVPGAVEFVLRHRAGVSETVLLLARGDRVHRVSLLHDRTVADGEARARIAAAAKSVITS